MISFAASWSLKLLGIVYALSATTCAQTTDASCTASFSWAGNPCLVTALLESLCNPLGVSVPALPAGNHYNGPSPQQATTCQCSTITYMMISACGACQDREWISWQNWSMSCSKVELSIFPVQLPSTIVVPPWAYMNISSINGTFNVDAAENNATFSQATTISPIASPISTSTSTSSILSTTPISSSTQTPAASAASTSHTNAGAIAGGVVGGLAGVVILALAIVYWFCIRRSKNSNRAREMQPEATQPEIKANSSGIHSSGINSSGINSYYTSSMSTVPSPFEVGRGLSPVERGMSPSSAVTSNVYTTLGHGPFLETGGTYAFGATGPEI